MIESCTTGRQNLIAIGEMFSRTGRTEIKHQEATHVILKTTSTVKRAGPFHRRCCFQDHVGGFLVFNFRPTSAGKHFTDSDEVLPTCCAAFNHPPCPVRKGDLLVLACNNLARGC